MILSQIINLLTLRIFISLLIFNVPTNFLLYIRDWEIEQKQEVQYMIYLCYGSNVLQLNRCCTTLEDYICRQVHFGYLIACTSSKSIVHKYFACRLNNETSVAHDYYQRGHRINLDEIKVRESLTQKHLHSQTNLFSVTFVIYK